MSEIFDDHRKDYNVIQCSFAGPQIMKDDIRAAIKMMKAKQQTQTVYKWNF